MALFAIGDLHLSHASNKPMDVFGGRWENYMQKLDEGFLKLSPDDVSVLCGDISWGMSLAESLDDFRYIDKLPGRKIILKGNHDYWWETVTKTQRFFEANGITSIDILHNNCYIYDEIAICGTRGWCYEAETGSEQDKKILAREIGRLEASLKQAGDREKLCFLHYPPRYRAFVSHEIVALLSDYKVSRCFYGHLHGPGFAHAVQGVCEGVEYKMVSADYLQFSPYQII